MVKDVYLFTNGVLMVFEENGQQQVDLQGMMTDELKKKIMERVIDGTRITFARWKKGFFELTRAEFMAAKIENEVLVLRFNDIGKPVELE